ncbi:hypothetical protein M2163_002859 [Streptomyces sp. SAI-135]|uniref:hypothetical protein n=1 Tax=unclassified Streptomyces TaxID=2593676 RepID=UPI002474CD73|nr:MULTISPECIES: hypothetical protein [unclassified Streptomyces]MDH6520158.1 hypothetical protein [Streptomyces sp. SAI-090]MDH6552374.1 hypothetical protein [Streptomyces sp. SAI-041]MDH6583577.1 hypothetical protein [Streptomyces sp. SAI-133]MDH6615751.1 hypothetical protein [Streptomyces sp. SAI-135]
MQTTRLRTSSSPSGRDLTPLLAGAGTAVGGFGALLALTGSDSPLRAPLTLFFLLAAPAAGIAAALRGCDPFARALASLVGSAVLNMLVAQGMLATHRWSARGGVLAMAAVSALILLPVLLRRRRTEKGQDV